MRGEFWTDVNAKLRVARANCAPKPPRETLTRDRSRLQTGQFKRRAIGPALAVVAKRAGGPAVLAITRPPTRPRAVAADPAPGRLAPRHTPRSGPAW